MEHRAALHSKPKVSLIEYIYFDLVLSTWTFICIVTREISVIQQLGLEESSLKFSQWHTSIFSLIVPSPAGYFILLCHNVVLCNLCLPYLVTDSFMCILGSYKDGFSHACVNQVFCSLCFLTSLKSPDISVSLGIETPYRGHGR